MTTRPRILHAKHLGINGLRAGDTGDGVPFVKEGERLVSIVPYVDPALAPGQSNGLYIAFIESDD